MNRWPIIISGFLQGLGMGALFVTMNVLAFSTLPDKLRTDAASMMNLARTIGASVGIAAFIGLLGRNYQISHADIAGQLTEEQLSPLSFEFLQRFGDFGGQAAAIVNAEVNRQALMIAYLDDFLLMSIVTALCIPLVFLMKRPAAADFGGEPSKSPA